MDVLPATIAVTGVAGVLAQRLLPLLDAMDGIDRIVGLDVREPARRVRRFEFHRVDVASSDLTAVLDGVETIVHLAGVDSDGTDGALLTHVNVEGTRKVLEAAATVGVRRIVQTSSAAVYGAWPNNPIPITEDAALRPNPGFLPALHDAENERRLAAVVRARHPATVGGNHAPHGARSSDRVRTASSRARRLGRPPVSVRGAARPIQVVHVDDAASALALAVTRDLDGVYNVAADGWVSDATVRSLVGGGPPALPDDLARRVLQALWSSGLGDAPPEVLPYLVHPWVVANDRLRAQGWTPAHSNESAIAASLPLATAPTARRRVVVTAAVVAGTTGAGIGVARVARRLKVRRARS